MKFSQKQNNKQERDWKTMYIHQNFLLVRETHCCPWHGCSERKQKDTVNINAWMGYFFLTLSSVLLLSNLSTYGTHDNYF